VRHHGRHDRSFYPFPGDTAISSGSCEFSCWMFRPDTTSGAVVYLQYDNDPANRFDVGLYIPAGDASTIYFRDAGQNVASKATFPIGVWQRLVFHVDLERKTYSADIAADGQAAQPVCRDVKYASAHNAFNMIEFSPQGTTGSVFFLDDVSLRWTPGTMFTPPGRLTLAEDGFEILQPGQSIDIAKLPAGARWKVREGHAADMVVDHDVSYGREAQSLRFRGSGGRVQLRAPTLKMPDDILLMDLDIFLRSELSYVNLIPNEQATSSDDVGFAWSSLPGDKPWFELRTRAGHWHCGPNGNLADTKIRAAFDAWNHLQLVLDHKSQTCRVTLQVIGAAPQELWSAKLKQLPPTGTPLAIELFCRRQQPRDDGPAFDNLRITLDAEGKKR